MTNLIATLVIVVCTSTSFWQHYVPLHFIIICNASPASYSREYVTQKFIEGIGVQKQNAISMCGSRKQALPFSIYLRPPKKSRCGNHKSGGEEVKKVDECIDGVVTIIR